MARKTLRSSSKNMPSVDQSPHSSLMQSATSSSLVPTARSARATGMSVEAYADETEDDMPVMSVRSRRLAHVCISATAADTTSVPPQSKSSSSTSPTDTALPSLASSPRDTLGEFDTPDTTPAASTKGASSMKRKRGTTLRETVSQVKSFDGTADYAEEDMTLARRLQEEEYNREDLSLKRVKRTALEIEDSEDLESELSDVDLSESDFDDVAIPIRRPDIKRKARISAPSISSNLPIPAGSVKRATTTNDLDADSDILSELGSDDGILDDESSAVFTGVSDDDESDGSLIAPTVSSSSRRQSRPTPRSRGRGRGGNTSAHTQGAGHAESDSVATSGRARRRIRERKKLEKAHPNIKTMWKHLSEQPIIKPVAGTQPEAITRSLKSFQLEGLDWMVKQEATAYKGGLLGDEMGMGKTIQAVSLIMSDYPQKAPTLVVVPPVALMQWSAEIASYTDGKLNVLVYHGQNNKIKLLAEKDLKKFDVIMISYNSLESLHRKETKGWSRGEDIIKEDSPIHAIHFHRLILDEAHSIKQRTTGVAKACFALKSTYKWCLSGTPVQNRIGEFFSLLRFLEVRPFADYFCKRCPCAIIHWQLDESHNCTGCGHTGMEHVSVFNQELLNPLTQSEDPAERTAAMGKLHMITARIMLRRVKKDHTSSMELPPKEVIVSSNFFGDVEKDFSSSIMSNSERKFNTYVSRNVVLNNYANIFGLIMQMRQVANHPDLLLKKHAQQGQNVLACQLCDEVAEDAVRSQCKHNFCRTCVKSYITSVEATGAIPDCPRCHIPLSIDLDQPEIEQDEDNVKKSSIINRIKMDDWTSSTKIEMLVYELYKLRSKKQTTKSIVFSNFTSMLQLVEWRLHRAGFSTVMLDGSMTPIQRQRSITYFMENPSVEVFLVSLKAGGVALNLVEASRVFIVDPWWNPAAEWQSADRCHRIGQRRPCVITRLCIEDSVESRMVMLQEKKANMINSTINNDKASFEKLTPEDMQFLFRGS